jgi:hypothetical protein
VFEALTRRFVMGSRCHGAALRSSVAVVTVAVVVPVASGGFAAVTHTSAVPAKLVGQWTRKVTRADVNRERAHMTPQDAIDAGPGIVWTLTIQRNGKGSLGGVTYWTGPVVPAGANRVHINGGIPYPNVYKWRVFGRLLTLAKISDSLGLRATVLSGVWKRKQ